MHEHQRFDDVAATWDDDPAHEERQVAVAQAIKEAVNLSPGMSAVDVGGGTGRLSILLADRVGSVVVTDPSPGMVRVARERIEAAGLSDRLRAVKADLTTDRLDGAYDVVWSSMALHHVQDLAGLLRSVAGLLVGGAGCASRTLTRIPTAPSTRTTSSSTDTTDSTGNALPSSWPALDSPTSASSTQRPSSRATASSACSCARRPRCMSPAEITDRDKTFGAWAAPDPGGGAGSEKP